MQYGLVESITAVLIEMDKGYHFVESKFESSIGNGWLSNSILEAIDYPETRSVRKGLCDAMLKRSLMQLIETRYSLRCSHTSHNSFKLIYRLTELGKSTVLNLHTPEWVFYPFDFEEIPNFYRVGYHLRGFKAITVTDVVKQHIEAGKPFVFKHKNNLWRFANGELTLGRS